MEKDYANFLKKKAIICLPSGHEIETSQINDILYDWQKDIVKWAVARGKAALFEDCGLGKTFQLLEWSRLICEHTGGNVLIVSPLAVSYQTVREAEKLGLKIHHSKDGTIKDGITITNYEQIEKFLDHELAGIVLDESSILKSHDGKTKIMLIELSKNIPYRLACTATPSPNDIFEIKNHSEFLSVMSGKELQARFFVIDGNNTTKKVLKPHSRDAFWKFISTWCVAIRTPAELGYDDQMFELPKMNRHYEVIDDIDDSIESFFNTKPAETMQERRTARKHSVEGRLERLKKYVDNGEQWILWCDFNYESEALKKMIPEAVEVKGSDTPEHKEQSFMDFSDEKIRILITKPKMACFGLNWQQCHNMAFVGVSDSYEQLYQAERRCWRFGQKHEVNVYYILSQAEKNVLDNIRRKQLEHDKLYKMLSQNVSIHSSLYKGAIREVMATKTNSEKTDQWEMYLGDCIKEMSNVKDESIGMSVFSPPFPGMYAYTNSDSDIGNSISMEQLLGHFEYLIPELYRTLIPGRSVCVHLTQYVAQKVRDGFVGMRDFRGKVIELFEKYNMHYYGEVTIDKNPQIKAIRTKDQGLLFKSLATDSAKMHMAMADWILQFRKPGDNPFPIRAGISERYGTDGWITGEEWILWARPVWYGADMCGEYGINETDVLNYRIAKSQNDEKHICPLQLGAIERCVKLWSAPGETVLSPFAGVGSEGYVSLLHGRKFIGIELKESYYNTAIQHLRAAEKERVNANQNLMTVMQ